VAEMLVEYALPTRPLGSVVVVMLIAAATVIERLFVTTPVPLSVTCTVKV
jgi:hypothetical protein